ncbi:hypothetical protein [Bacillus sp. FJAT-44742]|uniref:hypothetical protein n=1 Tax=Bacillus sp. FJAT-44742 TaxID=2014005 RepID=UPI000C24E874|nr:hypothetical protein [Bacillus sp. FJAT-44742]
MLNKDRINLRKKVSWVYYVGLSFVMAGLFFFLTSGFYMEEELEVLASPVGEDIRITSGTNIEIVKWIYEPEANEMEVILDLNDYRYEMDSIEYLAIQRSDLNEVTAQTVIEYESYVVLKLEDLDPDFKQISLQLWREGEDEDGEQDMYRLVTIYTDQREVKTGTISVSESDQGLRYITALLIERSEKTVEQLESHIEEIEDEMVSLEEQKQELRDQRNYQTEDEKRQTNHHINALEIEQNELETEVEQTQEHIEIEEERMENYIQRERHSSLTSS